MVFVLLFEQTASVLGIQEQVHALEHDTPSRTQSFTDEQLREIVERLQAGSNGSIEDALQRLTQCITSLLACMPQSVSQGATAPQLIAAALHSSAHELQRDRGASSSRSGSVLAAEVLSTVFHAPATQQSLVHAADVAAADVSWAAADPSASFVQSTDSSAPAAGTYGSAHATTHATADDLELAALHQQLAECKAVVDAKEEAEAAAKRARVLAKIAAVQQREAELDAQAAARAANAGEPGADAATASAFEAVFALPGARTAPPGVHASLGSDSDAHARSAVTCEHSDGVWQLSPSSPERSAAGTDALNSHVEQQQPANRADFSGRAYSAALLEASNASKPSISASTQAAESEFAAPDFALLGSTGQAHRRDHGEDLLARLSGDGAASSAAAGVSTLASSAAASRDSSARCMRPVGSARLGAVEDTHAGEAPQQHSTAPPVAQQHPRTAACAPGVPVTPLASALSAVSGEADTPSSAAAVSSECDASEVAKRSAPEPGVLRGEGLGSKALAAPVDTGDEHATAAQVADAQGPLSCSNPAGVVSGAIDSASYLASTVPDASDAVQSEAAIASPANTLERRTAVDRVGARPEAEQVDAPGSAPVQPNAVAVNAKQSPGPSSVAQTQVSGTTAIHSGQGEDAVRLPPSPDSAMCEQALQASGKDKGARKELPAAPLATLSAGASAAVSAEERTGASDGNIAGEAILQCAFVQTSARLLRFGCMSACACSAHCTLDVGR